MRPDWARTRMHVREYKSVGFVDAGACEGANIILAKRKGGAHLPAFGVALKAAGALLPDAVVAKYHEDAQTFAEIVEAEESREDARELIGTEVEAFHSSLWSIMGDGEISNADRFVKFRDSAVQFLNTILPKLNGDTAEKAGRKMSGARLKQLKEVISQLSALLADVDVDGSQQGEPMAKTFDASSLPKDAQDYIAGVEKSAADAVKRADELGAEVETLKAKVKEVEKSASDPEPTEEDALKALPEALRKRFEDAEAKAAAAEEKAEKAENERLVTKRVEVAKSVCDALPINADSLGAIMKRCDDKLDAEDVAELDRVLKASAEAIRKGSLFGEIGKTDAGNTEKSAADEIGELAKAYADENKVTLVKARTEVRKRHRELANREREEERAARRAA